MQCNYDSVRWFKLLQFFLTVLVLIKSWSGDCLDFCEVLRCGYMSSTLAVPSHLTLEDSRFERRRPLLSWTNYESCGSEGKVRSILPQFPPLCKFLLLFFHFQRKITYPWWWWCSRPLCCSLLAPAWLKSRTVKTIPTAILLMVDRYRLVWKVRNSDSYQLAFPATL